MPLFRRRHEQSGPAAPVIEESRFATAAAGLGWEQVAASVFDLEMTDAMRASTNVFHGHNRTVPGVSATHRSHAHDVFRADRDGRKVIVANAVTNINPGLPGTKGLAWISVCAVEMPTFISLVCVQPRAFRPSVAHISEVPTGDPVFDERFLVLMGAGLPAIEFTSDLRRLISAREDWIFQVHELLFTCFGNTPFESVDEMAQRIDEVLAVVAAFPESIMPKRVDHSQDDLVARISKLDNVDDTLAFLQSLTPEDREQLAASDTPLAAFADVKTPDEAIARLQSLEPAKQMQIMAMFERVDGGT